MKYTFTLLESHHRDIVNHLIQGDGNERVAFIICGRDSTATEERFLSREIVYLDDRELLASEPNRVSWDNNLFIEVLKKSEPKDFAVAIIHNHSTEYKQFSAVDDEGERELFKLAFNRNASEKPHPSLIVMPDGSLIGRVWNKNSFHSPISKFRIIGKRFKLDYQGRTDKYPSVEAFQRQSLAFGSALNQDLSNLKVTVVGAGATGSATAVMLARLGVREICLIDKDRLEITNLNRVHGSTERDVGKAKVEILKHHIESFGLNTSISIVQDWVSAKASIEHLKTSDAIFGCTDDHSGRILLNRFAYFYLVPVIDMGLVISVNKNSPPEIQDLQGRLTFLFPGGDCLLTREVINQDNAIAENLQRSNPETYKSLKEEAYVIGEGNPAPSVITFTTQIAAMAVNMLLNKMTGYNESEFSLHKLILFHRSVELNPGNKTENNCRVCGDKSYWGRGDMQPFLDMAP